MQSPEQKEFERIQNQTVAEWLREYDERGAEKMKAPKGSSEGFSIPEGLHPAVCSMVIDCGVWERTGKFGTKQIHELYLRWILPNCIIPDGEYAGQPAAVGNRYNFSMFKKANLRKDLETWRGKPFSDSEADSFDIEKVLGGTCNLQLYTSDAGYTNIQLITPYRGPRLPAPEAPVVFDTSTPGIFDQLPEWVQKKINLPSEEALADQSEYADVVDGQPDIGGFGLSGGEDMPLQQQADMQRQMEQPGDQVPVVEDWDDDIPFN